ncbi:MAG: alpha-mannosidase, partial [Acidobacteria bacterium]|nr:alpha-mannosidase [Acidobacteriota bacterium]
QAQFEVPALRWADLSDANGGLSVLNDSKYGYDAKDNMLRLTLLRSPKWPDPTADRGKHEFTYSLLPHAGGWLEAQTVRHGYELNYPLMAMVTDSHPADLGNWGTSRSFVKIAQDNVVLTALKKAEDSDEIILRFYEFAGKKGDVRIEFAEPIASAWETNLQEKPERQLTVQGTAITVPTGAYEIKTVKFRLTRVSP